MYIYIVVGWYRLTYVYIYMHVHIHIHTHTSIQIPKGGGIYILSIYAHIMYTRANTAL